jgi:hypothetical protein
MTSNSWTAATGSLTATQQRTVLDVLNLVASEDVNLVFGRDTIDGVPCLINAIGSMIKEVNDTPAAMFPGLVQAFDVRCRYIDELSNSGPVTPIMAEILIREFAALKPLPTPELEELPEGPISWNEIPDNVAGLFS